MRTRLKAKSVQNRDLVTPSSDPSPSALINFQQALVSLNEHGVDGGPSASIADGIFSDSGCSTSRCKALRCKTCHRVSL